MVKRIGGMRRKTRHKFMKPKRQQGKISLSRYFQSFDVGERVYLSVEPSVHDGMYHPRFLSRHGVIKGKQGKCYLVSITDINKEKTVIVHPVHLTKIEGKTK